MSAPNTLLSNPDALASYVRTFLDGCTAALSTLSGRGVTSDIALPLLPAGSLGPELVPLPWVIAEARSTRGGVGSQFLVLAQDDAAALAGLLLGEPVSEGAPLSADQEEALKETLTQMLGSASSALKVFLGRPIALSLGDVLRVDEGQGWSAHDATVATARFLVDGVPRVRFALTVPPAVGDQVASAQGGRPTGRAGEVVPSPPGLEMILDISMPVTVELGRTRMLIRDILALGPGSIIELEKLAGEPVDLLVNDRPIAKGDVVVIDESFGIRLTQISQAAERIRSLQ